jgi:hypothetical protein
LPGDTDYDYETTNIHKYSVSKQELNRVQITCQQA